MACSGLIVHSLLIKHELSAPHVHQQNGRAERLNETILKKANTLLLESGCPKSWWSFAFETAVHIYNRTPLRRTKWKTPYENMMKKKPDMSNFKIFGCLAYVYITKERRKNKLSPRAEPMIFIGYESKSYKFMNDKNTIVIAAHAIFDENIFPKLSKDKIIHKVINPTLDLRTIPNIQKEKS